MKFRGHEIELRDDGVLVFADTGEPTAETWNERPCGFCWMPNTPEGHDGCLGTLASVANACCGHGVAAEAYVQYDDGRRIGGPEALRVMTNSREGKA